MNVLLLTDDMLPGGIPRHVTDLANGLNERGVRVTVAASDGPFRTRLARGIRFVPIFLLNPDSYSKSAGGPFESMGVLRNLFQSERFDIVHTHKRYSDMFGRILARMYGAEHVSTCHNTFDSFRALSSFGRITIAVSRATEEMLIARFRKKPQSVVRIYNEIEPLRSYSHQERQLWKRKFGISDIEHVLVSIGQFIPSKDRRTLLDALKILAREGTLESTVCLVVGHGEEEEKLWNYAVREGLDRVVKFLPGTTDVEAVLNLADFCILTSVRDGGVPYVLLEAASLSKPHVATDVGGIPEFVSHGKTGLLVPPRDSAALAQAIDSLLRQPQQVRRLGRNALQKFKEQHGRGEFLPKTIEVYQRALARP
ncbi:MAG: glycosyltransferase family 4 protein [Bacteroidota bacterium]